MPGKFRFEPCPDCCETCPYGGPPDCTAPTDGTVTWFTHTANEAGTITRVNHSGRCYTYYVDSISGGGAETGDGTEANPWTNLNTVFGNTCIYNTCTTDGCPKVRVLVRGTIDYVVAGKNYLNYQGNLIIEPWGDGTIEVSVGGEIASAIRDCRGCVFKYVDATVTGTYVRCFSGCHYSAFETCTGTGTGAGFDNCPSSAFENCACTGVATDTVGYGFVDCYSSTFRACDGNGTGTGGGGDGFRGCYSSAFDSCTGTGDGSGGFSYPVSRGFSGCYSSTFHTCTGTGTCTGDGASGAAYGFDGCQSSTFYTCTGTGTGDNTSSGCGFRWCQSSTFYTCTGTGTGTDPVASVANGFVACGSSTFYTCTGTGTCTGIDIGVQYGNACGFRECSTSLFVACAGHGSSTNFQNDTYGVGFSWCFFSTFDTCDGTGDAAGPAWACKKACGFHRNDCSSFSGCTTSDRICEDCDAGECASFICDDLGVTLLRYEETIEGVLQLGAGHTILDIVETIEGVVTLEVGHTLLNPIETIQGVLTLDITHQLV